MRRLLVAALAVMLGGGAAAATLPDLQAQAKRALADFSAPLEVRHRGQAALQLHLQVYRKWFWTPPLHAALSRPWSGPGDGIYVTPPPPVMPDWLQAPLTEWLARQGWAESGPSPDLSRRWQVADSDGADRWAAAWVIAGPAVKEGVAAYRREGADTVARIGIDDNTAQLWMDAASALGWAVQWRLRDGVWPQELADVALRATFQAEGSAPRVWVVSPAGLFEARLQRLHWGGAGAACESWVELRWSGAAEPPVWAMLALANPAWALGAVVQRQAAAPGETEAQRGELNLSWPGAGGLPALRLRASRYEFWEPESLAEPDAKGNLPQRKLGDAWGSRAWVDAELLKAQQQRMSLPPLSLSGSPRCPVR